MGVLKYGFGGNVPPGLLDHGHSGYGALYSYDIATKKMTILAAFDVTQPVGGGPSTTVSVAPNGSYYGGSEDGPDGGESGALWKFDIRDNPPLSALHSGTTPYGQLIYMPASASFLTVTIADEAQTYLEFMTVRLSDGATIWKNYSDVAHKSGAFGRTLVESISGGHIFGVAQYGGEHQAGTIFVVAPNMAISVRDHFHPDGAVQHPISLIDGEHGKLYGTAIQTDLAPGVIFDFDPITSLVSTVHVGDELPKTGMTGISQKYVSAPVSVGNKLYGISAGGSLDKANEGVLYEIDLATSTYSVKVDFGHQAGKGPVALTRHSNGKIYGVASLGGVGGLAKAGAVQEGTALSRLMKGATFQLNNSASDISFFSAPEGLLFNKPIGQLIEGPGGKLYGVALRDLILPTEGGGAKDWNSSTSIYSVDPDTGEYTNETPYVGIGGLQTPPTSADLIVTTPSCPLLAASNGMYYGCTEHSLFEFDPSIAPYVVDDAPLYDFSGGSVEFPRGLTEGDGGVLYGVAAIGGAGSAGMIFELTVNAGVGTVTTIHDLTEATDGKQPSTAPFFVEGKVYGATLNGGSNGEGTYYRYTIATDTFEVLHTFGGAAGEMPDGSLFLASDGMVYGTTTKGGANDLGTLFRCELDAGSCTAVFDFTEASGYGNKFTQITEL